MLDLVMVAAIDSDRATVVDLAILVAIGSTPMHAVSFDTTKALAAGLVTTRAAAGN